MALLSLANLVYTLGERKLLDGVSLTLQASEHVGLIGRNGCGKSTLMKMIAGFPGYKLDSGQIQVARDSSVGYLSQNPELDLDKTLRDEAQSAFAHLEALHRQLEQAAHDMASAQGVELDRLMARYEKIEHQIQAAGGFTVDHQIDAALHGLGLTDEFFNVKVRDLSGGQKGRLSLAKLLLSGPDVLLLDEPTNHLDIAGRQWMEEFLTQYRGAVLLVSHDRWLLDRVVSKIYELHDGRIEEYPGNYRQYVEQRAQRRLTEQRVYDKQQEKIKHEQAFIDRYRAGQRARQAQGREKRLERFKRDEVMDRPVQLDSISLSFHPGQRSGDLVAAADHITKAYDRKTLFKDLSVLVKRGDRVGIIGPNGAGKSTLVNCLLGRMEPDTGAVRVGSAVNVGHYRQSHDHLEATPTVVDYLRRFVMGGSGAVGSEQAARDLAGAFLFTGQDQDKPLGVLSGGERSRAVLAGLMVGGHNLLVLDEPTNHLDIPSAERLEDALRQFTADEKTFGSNQTGPGTLLLITHDRMLLQNLANQLLIFDGFGHVRHFLGTYGDYLESQKAAAKLEAQAAKPAAAPRRSEQKSPRPAPAAPPKAKPSPLARINQETLEKKIVEMESRLAELDRQLADPQIRRDGGKVKTLQVQRQALVGDIKPLEEEWARRAEE